MRKAALIILFATFILVLAACTNNVGNNVTCGDGQCDVSESCACDDCKKEDKCKTTAIIATCDDSNKCTDDIFNELTKQCGHKTIENCCGNGKCEETERCDVEKAETVCPEDCQMECPAKALISGFDCAGENCKETSDNNFEITGNARIKSVLINVGERATGKISSDFRCIGENAVPVLGDYKEIKGLRFKDYFGTGDETSIMNSKISKTGNSIDYSVNFEYIGVKSSFSLVCNAIMQDESSVDLNSEIKLLIVK